MIKLKSLSIQIWLWFIGCIVISGIIISLIIFGSLNIYLKEQLYSNIEVQQQQEIKALQAKEIQDSKALTSTSAAEIIPSEEIKHIITNSSGLEKAKKTLPAQNSSINMIEGQTSSRYEDANTYYIISEQKINDENVYIFSYVAQNIKEEVLNRFWYIFLAIFIVIFIMFIPAHIISKRLTKPLIKLGSEMNRIAKRQWNEPIAVEGTEEFIDLAKSCESMRQELIVYDNKQQKMLQSISHELKTPIMVIRSYIQATKDGFYPKGNLDTTLDAIDQEANRLQKRVLDLIYITNLDYLTTHNKEIEQENIDLKEIIEEVYERLQYKRTDVNWKLELDKILINGDQEQWKVVFENLLQNSLRYSKNQIDISLKEENNKAICRIYNNGSPIEESKKDKLFNAFQKGNNGESGLGLNIVKRIVDLYDGEIWFENEEEGVSFYISISI